MKKPDKYRRCVGILLLNRAGQVFVAQRIDTPGQAWQMPQGGVDKGEDLLCAAKRELFEETSIHQVSLLAESAGWHRYDLPVDLISKVWKGRFRGQKQKWFAFRFEGQDGDINIATPKPEFSDWTWVEARRVPDLIVPFKRELYQKIIAEFEPYCTPV